MQTADLSRMVYNVAGWLWLEGHPASLDRKIRPIVRTKGGEIQLVESFDSSVRYH